ncbi:MAG TPA: hypothetical protein VN894_20725, partial [Polyangiaceae bacterium]|nr:hypothetical protein [Polyangiaceae bacterium]
DANVTHDFAAAIDVPISIVPPPADPCEVSPTSIETTGSFHHDGGAARRRRVAVLGGVGALGLIVFALAGWRAVHRAAGASPSAGYPSHPVATAGPARPPATAPAGAPVASSAPAPIDSVAPTPAVPVAASGTQRPPPAVSSAPAPKPSSTVAGAQKPSSPPMARPKPRSNSGYDPGAL